MASDAQIQANQRNSRLSCGPVTELGKRKSSQNARKHGFRAVREQVLLEEGYRYEERKRKWMSELDPRTDREEYFAHQQVLTSMMLDGVHSAYIEQVTTEIEEADEREDDHVHELGQRLYFNCAGLACTYGVKGYARLKAETSVSGKSVDADEPKKLVKQIASSARGCRWLIQEWTALKERLEGSKFWQSIDRFQAIRLLGKQPIEAGKKRLIAEIYAASHGIEPCGRGRICTTRTGRSSSHSGTWRATCRPTNWARLSGRSEYAGRTWCARRIASGAGRSWWSWSIGSSSG